MDMMDVPVEDFDFSLFDAHWEKLSEEQKVEFLKDCYGLDPEKAIVPVIAGITSFHFEVRNTARKLLGSIRENIQSLLEDPEEETEYLKNRILDTGTKMLCFIVLV